MEAARFGRYTVTSKLGAGAMGDVYAAVDEVLGRQVAVKTLRNQANGLGARMADERFRLEARAIAALTHPGIVQLYDIDLAASPPYLVMERVCGPSLRERLAQGPLAANEVRALGIQIARALAAAHAAGIVHRDVKPANILFAGAGTWKLADFGVAHVPDSTLTMTGQFVGSPAYASPEALVQGKSTTASDVFGLGATLYLAAAGKWPRADVPTAALLAPIPSLRELAPNIDADLIAVIDRTLALEPERRPSAAELADALAGLLPVASSPSPADETRFVPDATRDMRAERASSPVVDTVFVPDATVPVSSNASPARSPQRSWTSWLVGAAVVGGIITLALVKWRSTPKSGPAAASHVGSASSDQDRDAVEDEPTESSRPAIEDPPPGQIRAYTPPITDQRAARDWSKIVDLLYERRFEEARERLSEWERSWGESEETRSLHRQLAALPVEHP